MEILISAQKIAKAMAAKTLFSDLTLSLLAKDRMGIIGPNGSGKSTLIKILQKKLETDSGEVIHKRGLHFSSVAQQHSFDPNKNLFDQLATNFSANMYENTHKIETVLSQVGLENKAKLVCECSGGEIKRLGIAEALLSEPDFVFFDEPTNHLDLQACLWLEGFLNKANFGWALITHDRYFLEQTAQRILEINPRFSEGYFYQDVGYIEFLDKRQEFLNTQAQKQQTLKTQARRETEWLHSGVKARTTKSKSRIEAAHKLVDDLQEVGTILREQDYKVSFDNSGRKTKKLLEVLDIAKSFEDKQLFENMSLTLSPGTRLGLLGTNGSGKTTLMNILAARVKPDSGRVQHANDLSLSYFDQHRESLSEELTLKQALSDAGDYIHFRDQKIHVVGWAQSFGFQAEDLSKKYAELSGGEKARVHLSRFMQKPADVLLLDEPTNDLDIATLEALEEALLSFSGAIVLVSHDRFFLNKICTQFLDLNQHPAHIVHSYTQWESQFRTEVKPKNKEKVSAKNTKKNSTKKKLSYLEQREFDQMESSIFDLEEKLSELQALSEDPQTQTSAQKSLEVFQELEAKQAQLSQLYDRWAELEAKQN